MTINKYFFINIFTYGLVFFSPVFLALATYLTNQNNQNILAIGTAVLYFIGALAMIIEGRFLKETPLVEKPSHSWLKIVTWGLLGIVLAFFSQSLAAIIEQLLFPTFTTSENTANIMEMIKLSPVFILTVSIAGPIMEELLFRRAGTAFLSQYISPILSASLTSFLFALAHNDGHLIVYFIMGMVFYYLYQKTGSIWTSIIAHCGMNTLVVLIQLSLT